MSGPDVLFTLRNNFYLGAYQAAIAEAADLERLSEADSIERDCFVYRSYIELGSYEVSGSSIGFFLFSPSTRLAPAVNDCSRLCVTAARSQ